METAQIYPFYVFHVIAILIMASLKRLDLEIFHSSDSDVAMKRMWVPKNSVKKNVAIKRPPVQGIANIDYGKLIKIINYNVYQQR